MPRVEGVRYSSDGISVLCEHCDARIARSDDYAVQLNCPEEGIHDWIGPYCSSCMPKLKVCSCCNKAYFGDDIKYLGSGNWYCKECIDNSEICGDCGTLSSELILKGTKKFCKTCFDKKYFTCRDCGVVKTKSRSLSKSTNLNKAMYPTIFDEGSEICDHCVGDKMESVTPKEVAECKCCGKIHARQGQDYCPSCADQLPKCAICDKLNHQTQSRRLDGDSVSVCPNCVGKLRSCSNCSGETMRPKRLKGILGQEIQLCGQCYSKEMKQCTKCLKYSTDTVDGVCSHCSSSIGGTCENCGTEVLSSNPVSKCRACYPGYTEVYSYSYKPNPLVFHYTEGDKKDKDGLFMGFELELTVDNSSSSKTERLHQIFKSGKYSSTLLHATSDGSINGNGGFELVSYPMTLRYFKSINWKHLFTGMMEHSSCGMHVHIDRRAIRNKMHEYKLISFVNDNEELINEVAGRKYSGYQDKITEKPSALALGKRSCSRTSRVNLQNKGTIELRYFATTTSLYLFKARIQHVHSMVKYLRNAGVKEIKGKEGYIDFVVKNKLMYPEISSFLTSANRPWNGGASTASTIRPGTVPVGVARMARVSPSPYSTTSQGTPRGSGSYAHSDFI